ncbi:unnamed protein product [Rhodiola kirilowii]
MDNDRRAQHKSLFSGSSESLKTEQDELQYFRICLKWTCVDQSNAWRASLSWSVFFLLVIIVPILSHLLYSCSTCDEKHRRSYDAVVQISLSVFASVSFLCLSSWFRKYGLSRFLFLDRLYDVSGKVRESTPPSSIDRRRSYVLLCCQYLRWKQLTRYGGTLPELLRLPTSRTST